MVNGGNQAFVAVDSIGGGRILDELMDDLGDPNSMANAPQNTPTTSQPTDITPKYDHHGLNYQHNQEQSLQANVSIIIQHFVSSCLNMTSEDFTRILENHLWPKVASFEALILNYLLIFNQSITDALSLIPSSLPSFNLRPSPALISSYATYLQQAYAEHVTPSIQHLLTVLKPLPSHAQHALSTITKFILSAMNRLTVLVPAEQKARLAAATSQAVQYIQANHNTLLLCAVIAVGAIFIVIRIYYSMLLLIQDMQERHVLILGLDNSGKTTLLTMLQNNKIDIPRRTQAPNKAELRIGNIRIHATDTGGHDTARQKYPWEGYFHRHISGIVFVVDASDSERIARAAREINAIIVHPLLQSAKIVVLGNKIDLGKAMSEGELVDALGLNEQRESRDGSGSGSMGGCGGDRVRVYMCSIVHKMGYGEALQWLVETGK